MGKSKPAGPSKSCAELWGLLSKREREVLEHFLLCPHDKKIATALNLKPSTVRSHLASIQNKLGVASRVELVILLGRDAAARK